ncbi:hypothetical protein [Cypionkella sp.]|uniref:hypothetical protein n=1 Tax=Cypionkella sp. TaxID=2811411 RepID=UPI0026033179|nr:hypothetical protein [Cypionkella sp.]
MTHNLKRLALFNRPVATYTFMAKSSLLTQVADEFKVVNTACRYVVGIGLRDAGLAVFALQNATSDFRPIVVTAGSECALIEGKDSVFSALSSLLRLYFRPQVFYFQRFRFLNCLCFGGFEYPVRTEQNPRQWLLQFIKVI